MANILPIEKKVAVISMLCEGSSIRSIERVTGVHRDTVMRLGVKVGEAAKRIMDERMVELNCERVEVDELWGFIGKKQKNASATDKRMGLGDVWTFTSIDPVTKVMPCFLVGKRDSYHATAFMEDLASRMKNRIQLSSDAMKAYPDAVERAFGADVDYGQIVKEYSSPAPEEARTRCCSCAVDWSARLFHADMITERRDLSPFCCAKHCGFAQFTAVLLRNSLMTALAPQNGHGRSSAAFAASLIVGSGMLGVG